MAIYELDGKSPQLPADGQYFIAETATVIGNVRLKSNASVWFGSVLRGDNELIEIGEGSNVQDNCTFHTDPGFPLTIGRNCTIGHHVTLHGCTIGNRVLVGINTVVLDDVVIEDDVIIGAGSLVPPKKHLASGYLYVGSPVQQIRPLTEQERAFLPYSAEHYVRVMRNHQTSEGANP